MKTVTVAIISLICLVTIMSKSTQAGSVSQNKEFLQLTESAIDTLDKLEIIVSDPDSSKYEATRAGHELEQITMKLRRCNCITVAEQGQILEEIELARFAYMITIDNFRDEMFAKAKEHAQKALDLFNKYKLLRKYKAKKK